MLVSKLVLECDKPMILRIPRINGDAGLFFELLDLKQLRAQLSHS